MLRAFILKVKKLQVKVKDSKILTWYSRLQRRWLARAFETGHVNSAIG